MGKASIWSCGVAVTLFCAYAGTAAAISSQSPPWYLNALLVGSIVAFVVFLVTGIIYLVQKCKEFRNRNKGKKRITSVAGIDDTALQGNIRSRREAIEQSEAVWGLWYTGDGIRGDKLLRSGKVRRILLLNPSMKNQSIEENAGVVDCTASSLRSEINLTKDEAEIYHIPYKYYVNFRPQSFTIFDPTPIQNESGEVSEPIPNSENAWICTQHPAYSISRELWPRKEYKNKGKSKNDFDKYFREFEDIWLNNSVEPKEMELPFNKKPEHGVIKDTKVKLQAEGVEKATGMEINNVQADLSNVQVDVTAKNVKDAKGLSVTAHNTEFALSSRVIMCSCGNIIRSVTTCGYEPVITCPKCGKEHKIKQ